MDNSNIDSIDSRGNFKTLEWNSLDPNAEIQKNMCLISTC